MVKEYFEKNYKKIIIFPAILLIFSLIFLSYQYSSNGDLFDRDVDSLWYFWELEIFDE